MYEIIVACMVAFAVGTFSGHAVGYARGKEQVMRLVRKSNGIREDRRG